MSFFNIGLIYLVLFFSCFVFTLKYKSRLSKHDGDFPETIMKTFVIFLYTGVALGAILSLPFLISQAGNIQSLANQTLANLSSSGLASMADNFTELLNLK